ncbi:hypothetical protein RRG08_035747 [Elysia crispata]|uniref:Uncharacterized protein n=1 Tax=Elysia crispata TaxID=231223 RepID=A0AAE1DIC9_9GAST|nr:hypothetical protein RRG08_035747 [Elysia crispata]
MELKSHKLQTSIKIYSTHFEKKTTATKTHLLNKDAGRSDFLELLPVTSVVPRLLLSFVLPPFFRWDQILFATTCSRTFQSSLLQPSLTSHNIRARHFSYSKRFSKHGREQFDVFTDFAEFRELGSNERLYCFCM